MYNMGATEGGGNCLWTLVAMLSSTTHVMRKKLAWPFTGSILHFRMNQNRIIVNTEKNVN